MNEQLKPFAATNRGCITFLGQVGSGKTIVASFISLETQHLPLHVPPKRKKLLEPLLRYLSHCCVVLRWPHSRTKEEERPAALFPTGEGKGGG